MEQLLQRDYWQAMAESIWIWLEREVFVGHTLINLVAVVATILLAGLIARALKPKLSEIIEKRISKNTGLSRFLSALDQILTHATAIILLWVVLVVFRQLGLKIYLDTTEQKERRFEDFMKFIIKSLKQQVFTNEKDTPEKIEEFINKPNIRAAIKKIFDKENTEVTPGLHGTDTGDTAARLKDAAHEVLHELLDERGLADHDHDGHGQ